MLLKGEPQLIPFVCPECNTYLDESNIIGKGEYFKFDSMFDYGICFECPKCFAKSKCHCETPYYEKLEISA